MHHIPVHDMLPCLDVSRQSSCVPQCGLQFGPGEMQQHGFARNLEWEIGSTSADLQPDERDPEVELVLTDNDYTRGMWCGLSSALCCGSVMMHQCPASGTTAGAWLGIASFCMFGPTTHT